jgi:hypothetical protein
LQAVARRCEECHLMQKFCIHELEMQKNTERKREWEAAACDS